MKRRSFLKRASAVGLTAVVSAGAVNASKANERIVDKPRNDREYWVDLLEKIATPVLSNMSRGELKKNMKPQYSPTWDNRDSRVAYMEAFGRLIAGVAPFTANSDRSKEGAIAQMMRTQILKSLEQCADPKAPDYLYWGDEKSRQPLVDAAYIAQALLAAPNALWTPLDGKTKENIIREFTTIRRIKPFNNNWVLFAAMIETFLLSIGEKIDAPRIDSAIETIQKWYVGDGWYADGDKFHFDHYNGYVIHPMLCEVLRVNSEKGRIDHKPFGQAYLRMQRYASFQERYISPEGTYPVFGRSSTYRIGAFQPLAKLALDGKLPKEIVPAQVRCALTAVMKRMFIPTTFTKEGWLTLGLVGEKQASLADYYSNTGSMYLTSLAFLPLGLSAEDPFWSAPFTEWTELKAWSGKPFAKDYAVDY